MALQNETSKPVQLPFASGEAEADQPGIDATDHLVPALHRGKCITIGGPAALRLKPNTAAMPR